MHVLTLSKLINLSARYQNSSDMRFFRAGRLYFNHDVFSFAMVLLIILLSKTRINFIYVNIICLRNRIYVSRANVIATLEFLT